MKVKLFDVVCPNCGSNAIIQMDTVFNHEFESERLSYILDKRFFYRKCSKCNQIVLNTVPVLYYFSKQKQAICFLHERDIQIDGYKMLYTYNIDSFIEALRIVYDNINYDEVLQIKELIGDDVSYDGSNEYELFFLNRKTKQIFTIKRKVK